MKAAACMDEVGYIKLKSFKNVNDKIEIIYKSSYISRPRNSFHFRPQSCRGASQRLLFNNKGQSYIKATLFWFKKLNFGSITRLKISIDCQREKAQMKKKQSRNCESQKEKL
jgi:hypothetical protein